MNRRRFIAVLIIAAVAAVVWSLMRPAPKPDGDGAAGTEVAIKVARLRRMSLHRYVSVFGLVEPRPAGHDDPGGGAQLSAPLSGLVANVFCAEGDRVEAGQVLVQLDTRPVDVQIHRAREQVQFAEQQHARQQKLMEIDGTSQRVLQEALEALNIARDSLAAAEAQRHLLQITAPFGGIVARVRARPGQSVDLSSVLVELVNPDDVVITAGIPAAQLSGIEAGQLVDIAADGAPAMARGTLIFLSPQIDPQSGTALARVAIPPDTGLYPGQFVDIHIEVEVRRDRLAAPAESVVQNEDGATVIAVVDGIRASQVPVEAGLRDGDWIEVEGDGLAAGDVVVTAGAFGLPKNTAVRILTD